MQIAFSTEDFIGKSIQNYSFQQLLGEGGQGKVFKAENVRDQSIVAIKVYIINDNQTKFQKLIQTEIEVLKNCSNDNVVKLLENFRIDQYYFLVMEYCEQLLDNFHEYLKRLGNHITEKQAIKFLKQIVNGMKGLHKLSVIHRDLKLQNILIQNKVLKICDLGIARQFQQGNNQSKVNSEFGFGTFGNMAPEMLESKPYGFEVDMFSLGVLFYQMIFGERPYNQDQYFFLRQAKNRKIFYYIILKQINLISAQMAGKFRKLQKIQFCKCFILILMIEQNGQNYMIINILNLKVGILFLIIPIRFRRINFFKIIS